jgi:hypothetical protein
VRIAADALFVDVETSLSPEDVWMVAFASTSGKIQQVCELERSRRDRFLRDLDRRIRRLAPSQLVQWSAYDRNALEAAYWSIGQSPPKWLDRKLWLDAMHWTSRAFALPLSSLSVKSVSAYFEYKYAEADLDGLTVGSWYQNYLSGGRQFPVARVKLYNRDDVEAVRHVVETLQRIADLEPEPRLEPKGRISSREPRKPIRVRTLSERRALVARAVANFRKAMMVRVEAGLLKRSAAEAGVARFHDHMRRAHLAEGEPSESSAPKRLRN